MNDSKPEKLDCVVTETGPDPTHAVIWLHGLGADGHDFEPIVPQLGSAARRSVRFIFPHAPVRPVTINGGMAMRAWYDILGMQIDRDQDQAGIVSSLASVDALLDEQLASGIAPANLVLAGFSQGGAIALRCGLARSKPLGGIVALSCYMLDASSLSQWAHEASSQVPVFMGHGSNDPVVPVDLGKAAAEQLNQAGYPVRWLTWPMPHSVCLDEVRAIDQWLDEIWT
jgi:phospholipase/carboxylesterase